MNTQITLKYKHNIGVLSINGFNYVTFLKSPFQILLNKLGITYIQC